MKYRLIVVSVLLCFTNIFAQVAEVTPEPPKSNRVSPQNRNNGNHLSDDAEIRRKSAIAERLINDAVTFFEETPLGEAFRAFEKDERWRNNGFEVGVFDASGNCYLFGKLLQVIFVNFKDPKAGKEFRTGTTTGTEETDFIKQMVTKAEAGGGWVSFDWLFNDTYAYVRMVIKDGIKFILFTNTYPESQRFQIRELVKSGIHYADEYGIQDLFAQINNPTGEFVRGDLYLWAYDMEGNAFAHGRNLALVGQNLINFKDSSGRYRNKNMIDLVKKKGSGWIEYDENGILKYGYVELLVDRKTNKQYIVGGGYYPKITQDMISIFVKRAIEYLKANGPTVAFRDFTSYAGGFIEGPLRITVLSLDGAVLADAYNPIFIGQNIMNLRDPEGKYIAKEIVEIAKTKGRGWVTYVENRAYKSLYLELVETPDGKYIVTSGFWPASKQFSAEALAEKAVVQLQTGDLIESLRVFTAMSPDYIRGDLFVEVYTEDGICLAYGLDRDRIWNDEKTILDDKGIPLINRVLDVAKTGGGWTEYPLHKGIRKVYAKQVTKEVMRHVELVPEVAGEKEEEQKTLRVTKKEAKKKEFQKQTYTVAVGYFE